MLFAFVIKNLLSIVCLLLVILFRCVVAMLANVVLNMLVAIYVFISFQSLSIDIFSI
jgi:hypothetical protein